MSRWLALDLLPVALLGLALAWPAAAQPSRYQGAEVRPGDGELQARSCVGELGAAYPRRRPRWDRGCAALTGVHARRAAAMGVSLGRMARAYSAPMKPGGGQPWVRHLVDRAEPPRHWPAGAHWPTHRRMYRHALDVVRRTLAGELADPCEEEAPMHHGGREGVDAPMPAGWREVRCDETPQRFWAREREGGQG